VPHVVAVDSDTNVLDSSARVFAEVFYESLIAGMTVQTAFDLARERLVLEDSSSASHTHVEENSSAQFLLLGDGDHKNAVLFPLSGPADGTDDRGLGLVDQSPPVRAIPTQPNPTQPNPSQPGDPHSPSPFPRALAGPHVQPAPAQLRHH
jgi:hypothetical protein